MFRRASNKRILGAAAHFLLDYGPNMGTIVPNMGTTLASDNTSTALFGKVRRAVLALLLTDPQKAFFLREVVREVGAGRGAVQRELANLVNAGILKRSTSGRQVYFQADPECPVYPELAGLLTKTAGVAGLLKQALAPLSDSIRSAFIYGSFARNQHGPASDVDLMVVGDLSLAQVVEAISSIQERLGREINPSVYPAQEFVRKVSEHHHFLSTVIQETKIFLIGGEDELARLAGQRLADRA